MKTLIFALLFTSTTYANDFAADGVRAEMEFKAMVNTKGFRTGWVCAELFTSELVFSAKGLPLPPVNDEPIFGFSPLVSWPY